MWRQRLAFAHIDAHDEGPLCIRLYTPHRARHAPRQRQCTSLSFLGAVQLTETGGAVVHVIVTTMQAGAVRLDGPALHVNDSMP